TESRFKILIREMKVPRTDDPDADIRWITAEIQKQFEEWIREHPEQWMWSNKRWPERNRKRPPVVTEQAEPPQQSEMRRGGACSHRGMGLLAGRAPRCLSPLSRRRSACARCVRHADRYGRPDERERYRCPALAPARDRFRARSDCGG